MTESEKIFQLWERWVEAEWVAVAAAAWRHYIRTGAKGALEIQVEDIRALGEGRGTRFMTDYLISTGRADVDVAIAEHDPARAAVVLFVNGEESWLHVASHEPPPPEAHRQTAN